MSVVGCTDLSDKELHRQVAVGKVVTSGSLCGVMVSILAQNVRDMGSIPTLGTIFPISTTPATICRNRHGEFTGRLGCEPVSMLVTI